MSAVRSTRTLVVGLTLVASATLQAEPVRGTLSMRFQQAEPPPPAAEEELSSTPQEAQQPAPKEPETVVITGSAIERRELTTTAPVAILDRSRLDAAGEVSIGQILQNIPAQSNAINIQFNNGGDGSTRINLRGLGSSRTLVLLNGRRVVPGGTGADASVDLNAIPLAVIERVEVLKDGASAIYGSDAVAGVVNIITRDDFRGVEATAYTGATQRGDGLVYDVSAVAGVGSDRGSMLFSGGYSSTHPVWAGDRDFSSVARALDWQTGKVSNIGSTATPNGYLKVDGDGTPATAGNDTWSSSVLSQCPSGFCTRSGLGQPWRPFLRPEDTYNYQPENYLVTPLDRYNLFSQGHYRFLDKLHGFFEGLYTNRSSQQRLAPEPLMLDQAGLVISQGSIYNPYGKDINFYRRRLEELGPRSADQTVDMFRIVSGFDGAFPDVPVLRHWKWEVSYNYGRTQAQQINDGNLIKSHVQTALGPSYRDAAGVAHCGTSAAPGPAGCVPLDLLDGMGSITPDMASYLTYTGISSGFNEQQMVLATARGLLFETPWSGFGAASVGVDYRREAGGFDPDPMTASGDTTGNAAQPTHGSFNVAEGYAELSFVPLSDRRIAKWVEIDAAVRGFHYDTFGSGVTWKAGGLFRTIGGVAVRGTYSTAFRSPAISELYSGAADSFPQLRDPCDTSMGALDPNVAQRCAAEGVPTSYNNPVTQLRTQVGGNPRLQAETADIYTAGIVYEPPRIPGLALTADYFDIAIDHAIQPLGADVILANCYRSASHTDCDKIHRRPGTFVIDYIDDRETNVGGNNTSGLDFAVAYARRFRGVGQMRFMLEGTWLFQFDEITATRTLHGLGVYDLGVYPDLKTNFIVQWVRGGWNAGTNVRYIDGFKECQDNACNTDIGMPPAPSRDVDAYVTADLYAGYAFQSGAGRTSFTVGVNNVADQQPVVIYNGFLANSDASTYDYLGRYVYVRLSQLF
jgi:outer membrane receptor protein involved in Fe transport